VKFLDALVKPATPIRPEVARAYQPPPWMFDGQAPAPYITSYGEEKAERIADTFAGYVAGGLMGNTVVAAVEWVRVAVFSEIRFQFQQLTKGRPGNLFGGPELSLLERPWPGGTTGDLTARMLLDADMAGNSFETVMDDEFVRLRPDWVEIVFDRRLNDEGRQVGWKKLGYLYYEGGMFDRPPAVFLVEEVAHFMPKPDPLARYRGMSWLTPVVREIQADSMATRHKLKFFENAATPNLAVSLPKEISDPDVFKAFVDVMEAKHGGVENAYRTLYTGGGADVTVVGADMRQIDFKTTQGTGETRIAAAGGVHPAIVALSEGLQGASLNAGNFSAARRLVSDVPMRSLWRNAAGSLEVLVPPPYPGSRLWYDDRDVAFLREDAKDAAEIAQIEAATIGGLVRDGFTAGSAVAAVSGRNMDLLVHSDLVSVQLVPPGGVQDMDAAARSARNLVEMVQKVYLGVPSVLTAEEARRLLNQAGAGLPPSPQPTPSSGNGKQPANSEQPSGG